MRHDIEVIELKRSTASADMRTDHGLCVSTSGRSGASKNLATTGLTFVGVRAVLLSEPCGTLDEDDRATRRGRVEGDAGWIVGTVWAGLGWLCWGVGELVWLGVHVLRGCVPTAKRLQGLYLYLYLCNSFLCAVVTTAAQTHPTRRMNSSKLYGNPE